MEIDPVVIELLDYSEIENAEKDDYQEPRRLIGRELRGMYADDCDDDEEVATQPPSTAFPKMVRGRLLHTRVDIRPGNYASNENEITRAIREVSGGVIYSDAVIEQTLKRDWETDEDSKDSSYHSAQSTDIPNLRFQFESSSSDLPNIKSSKEFPPL